MVRKVYHVAEERNKTSNRLLLEFVGTSNKSGGGGHSHHSQREKKWYV